MKLPVGVLAITFFITLITVNGQETIDTLINNKSFNELREGFFINRGDVSESAYYAKLYLKKATQERDTLKMMYGFYYLLITDPEREHYFSLYDSIAKYAEYYKEENFLAIVNYEKGLYYAKRGDVNLALQYYLDAMDSNIGNNKEHLEFLLNNVMGLLKTRVGEYDEAKMLFKKSWKYGLQHDYDTKHTQHYLSVLFSLSDVYRRNREVDSAAIHNLKGLKLSLDGGHQKMYANFLLNDGVINFYKKNYDIARDSISKSIPLLIEMNNRLNLPVAQYYLGKIEAVFDNIEKAKYHFEQMDLLLYEGYDIDSELRDAYVLLIDHYKSKDSLEQQLYYINRLQSVDSLFLNNERNLIKNMHKKYDTPSLLKEKQMVIDRLNQEKSVFNKQTRYLVFSLGILLIFAIYQYHKKRSYKKRLDSLSDDKVSFNSQGIEEDGIDPKSQKLDISPEIVADVLNNLSKFEQEKGFLNTKLTSVELANILNTNTTYLSKVINAYKNINFSTYIRDLRVCYAFNRIRNDATFRKYTIKAIAKESGFKGAESFSKAFYQKYKVYPSHFIKKMNEVNEENLVRIENEK